MGIVRFEHGLTAALVSTRHDFGSSAPHRNTAMRYTRDSISGFHRWDADQDEIARIAMILAIFESAWNPLLTYDGDQQCEICMSGSPIRTYCFLREAIMSQRSRRIACQNTRRSKKVISLRMISEKLKAWRRHREAMRELSQLSDHELSDIGIGRGDIEYVVRRPVTSKPSA
jgi:uncharacterized protein YjiS (DUF1127 family)